jgi:hypothetical protein
VRKPWVLTRLENFHLALLASEEAPGINDLAILLAKAMEHPWVMGKRRPARIVLRDNPQWDELIPHLRQLKIEVVTQQGLPLWDDAAADYVRRMRATRSGRGVPMITGSCPVGQEPRTYRDRCRRRAWIRGPCRREGKRQGLLPGHRIQEAG